MDAPVLPCRLRPKGGEQWGPGSGPSATTYHGGGETNTAPADSPMDLSLLLFMDLLMERR